MKEKKDVREEKSRLSDFCLFFAISSTRRLYRSLIGPRCDCWERNVGREPAVQDQRAEKIANVKGRKTNKQNLERGAAGVTRRGKNK